MLALMAEREQTRTLLRAKVQKIIQKTAFLRKLTRFLCRILFNLYRKRYIEDGNSPRKQLNSIKMMNRKVLFWPLAARDQRDRSLIPFRGDQRPLIFSFFIHI